MARRSNAARRDASAARRREGIRSQTLSPSRRATQSASVHRRDAHEHRRVDGGEQLVPAEEVAQEAVHHAELALVLLERCTLGGERGGGARALAPSAVRAGAGPPSAGGA